VFSDRVDAGRQLAQRVSHLRGDDVVVLGLPRGGVPVAHQVAQALNAPLDVIVVRKLGSPFKPELAMGAIGEDGVRVLNQRVLAQVGATESDVRSAERRETPLLQQRLTQLRSGRKRLELDGRTAVVVDDGIATGSTARAACTVARRLGATRVVLAVPVAPAGTARRVPEADEVICVATPAHFKAVSCYYRDFSPTGDDEVADLLHTADRQTRVSPASPEEGKVR